MSNSAKPPAPPKIRRATLTQSDAKLYAMTQVIWGVGSHGDCLLDPLRAMDLLTKFPYDSSAMAQSQCQQLLHSCRDWYP